MRKSSLATLLVGGVVFFIALATLAMNSINLAPVAQVGADSVSANNPAATVIVPKAAPQQPSGIPAIPAIPGKNPAFSKDDVVKYFQANNLPKNLGPLQDIHVVSVEFITSQDVSKRLQDEPTGFPDSYSMCYVTLSGKFIFADPQKGNQRVFDHAFAVFDSTTGNLLLAGTI